MIDGRTEASCKAQAWDVVGLPRVRIKMSRVQESQVWQVFSQAG